MLKPDDFWVFLDHQAPPLWKCMHLTVPVRGAMPGHGMQRSTQQQYARRVQRLLALINEIKTNPRQTPQALWTAMGISRAMFYKDRAVLATLGFTFGYKRRLHQHVITQDQFLPVLNLTTSEVLALIMAVLQAAKAAEPWKGLKRAFHGGQAIKANVLGPQRLTNPGRD